MFPVCMNLYLERLVRQAASQGVGKPRRTSSFLSGTSIDSLCLYMAFDPGSVKPLVASESSGNALKSCKNVSGRSV